MNLLILISLINTLIFAVFLIAGISYVIVKKDKKPKMTR